MSAGSSRPERVPVPDAAALRHDVIGTLLPGFSGVTAPAWLLAELRAGAAGVALYGENVEDRLQLGELVASVRAGVEPAAGSGSGSGIIIALDEEGGDVTRVHYRDGSPQPGHAVLGRIDDVGVTASAAAQIGEELAHLGVTLNLAPVADVNSTAENPVIGPRSFGADPELVAAHTAAWVRGLQSRGVAACLKHFPGHGDTSLDSHLALPRVEATAEVLEQRELPPFVAGIEAGTASIMTSHLVLPALDPERPATFSPAILTGLLRERLGFEGVIVTDALDMRGASEGIGIPEAAVRSLVAGADLLCLGPGTSESAWEEIVDAIVTAVHTGRLSAQRVRESAARVRMLISTTTGAHPALTEADPAAPFVAQRKSDVTSSPQPTDLAEPAARRNGAVTPSSQRTDLLTPVAALPEQERIIAAFRRGPGVAAWLADPAPVALVQLEAGTNQAVGEAPWGPAAAGADIVGADEVYAGAKVAVLGRGLAEGHPLWKSAEALRAAGHHVLSVECGVPRNARPDLVTYGASRGVGEALATLLLGTQQVQA